MVNSRRSSEMLNIIINTMSRLKLTPITLIPRCFVIILLYITLILSKAYAQEYKVESFEIVPKDLSIDH